MELRELLKISGLTEGMNEEQVNKLLGVAVQMKYDAQETIIPETTRSRDLYLVERGSVSICMSMPMEDRDAEVIDRLHAGKILGEVAFIDGSPRSATVIAEEATKLYVFPYDKLYPMMEEDTRFGYVLLRAIASVLTAKVRQTNLAWRNLMMW